MTYKLIRCQQDDNVTQDNVSKDHVWKSLCMTGGPPLLLTNQAVNQPLLSSSYLRPFAAHACSFGSQVAVACCSMGEAPHERVGRSEAAHDEKVGKQETAHEAHASQGPQMMIQLLLGPRRLLLLAAVGRDV